MNSSVLLDQLHAHLARWGLRHVLSDADYFAWQRDAFSSADLNQLNQQVERKRSGALCDDIAFYDLTAQPHILPVLYSQRYEYYCEIGARVAARLSPAQTVLDVGCGIGILTTFYAQQYPQAEFVGIDRSPASIARAQEQAERLGLTNVRFHCADLDAVSPRRSYDLIVATHALVQAEQDPGVPSRSWETFERDRDGLQQADFERRTGLGSRLDRLASLLAPGARVILFEKTSQLARRVPFQRALAARGWHLAEQPEPVRYRLVEEVADDGPFYVLGERQPGNGAWDESPEPDEGLLFDATVRQSQDPHAPLYENHWPSAQRAWEQLTDRMVLNECTRQEADGRQLHVELGRIAGGIYLYCANTFDQRQLVIVPPDRVADLEGYYQEIVQAA
ncbi:MAG: methyltransferase domain-containing protein [Nitrospira sp.]|jgi:SAM-dependent methyltransferase|nr:methyltransferase domain-containing protein [Nitrospira sp.]